MLSKKRALKQFIERHIKEGFLQRDDIIQATLMEFRGEFGGPDFDKAVAATVDRHLARYLIMESAWVASTDCDKIERAFRDLEKMGVVTRQHFACCNDCGHREMQSELRRLRKGASVRGFAFFHHQDTQRAIKQGTLFLTFDAIEKNVEKAVEIGGIVLDTIRKTGLKAEWSGSYLQRIAVSVNWRKRRFSAAGVDRAS